MCRLNFLTLFVFIYLLTLQPFTIECRPHTQRIIVHGHEWTVPNEPGWEKVLQEAETFRHRVLSNCASSRECRLATEQLRRIFLSHPVSAKYYDDSMNNDVRPSDIDSIFKWG